MPRYIVKLSDKNNDYYLEWSSVVDAPVTYGMSLTEFKKYYNKEYGRNGMKNLGERLQRVKSNGTSCELGDNINDFISTNRAGDREKRLSKKEIINKYCIQKKI